MGNQRSIFTDDQLEMYQDCTYFTVKEILKLHGKFRDLSPNIIPRDMTGEECTDILLPPQIIKQMPELKENPFSERVVLVFSEAGSGYFNFENFLDMFNVFSENAPRDTKAFYAFKIYDYDGDQSLNQTDLELTLVKLTRNKLTKEELKLITKKVIDEAEMDNDMRISFMEFEHVISRAPDFLKCVGLHFVNSRISFCRSRLL